MKLRRSISSASLEVARQAIHRCPALVMTVHAEAHRQLNVALGDRSLVNRAVTGCAADLGIDVRGVVELHMRLRGVVEDAAPDEVFAALAHRRDLLDAWTIGG